jgi:hypothetical protein
MIHILNNMNYDDNLQLGAMMHKLLNHKIKMLTIDEIQDNHKLRLEHLNMKYNFKIEDKDAQEVALFQGQFQGKCRNDRKIGHKAQNCKIYKISICSNAGKHQHSANQQWKRCNMKIIYTWI